MVLRRGADCAKACEPVRPSEARSHREQAKKQKTGGPRQSARSACLPTARSTKQRRPRGASAGFRGRGAGRNARGPAVRAQRGLPGPGKRGVQNAGGLRLSPRSGRQARSGGREGAPPGRTGAVASGRRGGAERSAARPRRTMAAAREGRGERRGRRCTKPAGSDAAARPRRLQRRPPTSQIFETSTQNQPSRLRTKHAAGKKTPREDQQGRCRTWGRGKGRRRPCPSAEGKDAGGVTGLEQRNALARPLLPPDGVAGGNSPFGGCKGGAGKMQGT